MGYVVGFSGGGDWFWFVFSLHTGLIHFLTPTLVDGLFSPTLQMNVYHSGEGMLNKTSVRTLGCSNTKIFIHLNLVAHSKSYIE